MTFLAVVALFATQGTAAVEDISLSTVVADVEAHSPAVTASRARAAAQERRSDAVGWWADPFVAAGPDEYTFGADMPVVRVQVTQAIPLPGKLAPRVDAARAQARGAAEGTALVSRALHVAAVQLFFRGLYIERARAANVAQRALLDDVIASAEARYVAGGSAHHEVLLATAEQAILERDGLALERESMVLVAQLDELRGLPPRPRTVRLVDDDVDDGAAVPSLEDALAQQPELRAAGFGVQAAAAREGMANVAALPDLVVQGMYMQSFHEDEKSNAGAMIGVNVPLFLPWKQGALAEGAARERSAFEAEREALKLRLVAEWQEASTRLRTAEDTLRLYEDKIVPATNAAFESSKAAYVAQGAPLVELLAIARSSTSVTLESYAAGLDVRLAKTRLRQLLSSPPVLELAPRGPTLFGPSMGGAGMTAMPRAMGNMGMRAVRMGPGMAAPTTLESDDGAGGMGGM